MAILGGLTKRLIGRKEPAMTPETAEMRAHVMGEYPPMPPETPPAGPPGRFGRFENVGAGEVRAELPELASPMFPPPPSESMSMLRQTPSERPELARRLEERGIYELFDRLSVIESQLAALRAQAETINERLKMIEFGIKAGKGYY